VWLSGDRSQLGEELDRIALAPEPQVPDDDSDRIELLRSIAGRMKNAADLSGRRCESPRTAAWLDLLNHLSADSTVN
jgi:hypothetical protein